MFSAGLVQSHIAIYIYKNMETLFQFSGVSHKTIKNPY